jgi:hypothetical protein
VIVLLYGHYESIHLFLPRWLERHANSLRARPRALSAFYRKRLLRPAWMFLAKLQARLDARLRPSFRFSRIRTVPLDLEAYIKQVQKIASPMVIVMEILPPADRQRSWFPRMTRRIALVNEANRAMVERLGLPHVRWFTTSDLVDEHFGGDLEAATPDGFHYCPELHRLIGEKLSRVIAEWADTQPHLTGQDSPIRTTRGTAS